MKKIIVLAGTLAFTLIGANFVMAQDAKMKDLAEKRFNAMDTNKDGSISKEEFFAFQMGRSKDFTDAAEKRFKSLDVNKDEFVTEDEFASVREKRFKKLDENGDGFLTRDEFKQREKVRDGGEASPNDAQKDDQNKKGILKFFEKVDKDGDNKINLQEYMAIMSWEDFKRADSNNDNKVTFAELKESHKKMKQHAQKDPKAPIKEERGVLEEHEMMGE